MGVSYDRWLRRAPNTLGDVVSGHVVRWGIVGCCALLSLGAAACSDSDTTGFEPVGGAGGGGAAGGSGGQAGATPFAIDPNRVLADVAYLASPDLLGRASGTAGNSAALDYVEALFSELGLQPAGDAGTYRQAFGVAGWGIRAPMAVSIGGSALTAGTDYLSLQYGGTSIVTAEIVFVGYGMTIPAFDPAQYAGCPIAPTGYDDYGGVDLTGKIALVLRHGPNDAQAIDDNCPANSACLYSPCLWDLGYKAANAATHGAAAMIVVEDYDHPAEELASGTLGAPYYIANLAALFMSRTPLEAAIADLPTWAAAIDSTIQPTSHATGVSASLDVQAGLTMLETANLLGVVPGTDPIIGSEVVVVSGHIDHLGKDLGTGQIFLGADDNASGTAVTMELARALALGDVAPARTVLFAAWNGEEEGLIGSCFYVDNPTLPIAQVKAMFSLDMVGAGNESGVDVYNGTLSSDAWLMDVITGASADDALSYDVNPMDPLDLSDHVCFQQAGAPAVMIVTSAFEDHAYLHTPEDTIDHVSTANLEVATRVTWAAVRTLAMGQEGIYTQGFRATGPNGPTHWRGHHPWPRSR
jgi:hypothetical protein